ncbi:DUF4258 domain-containing protein [Patescibacteria group bacterium]|nr:DUF4258 domain-containing protein [Patescibacteria group bacterium]
MAKINDKYQWTKHSIYKMRCYGLSQQRIKRIIRHPARIEEAIVPSLIAAMSPYGRSPEGRQLHKGEIWVMYQISKKQIKIITAWRYPGKSSARDPIPQEILDEIKSIV